MRLSELDYELPPELIAQEPADPRDQARLEVIDRARSEIEHSRFYKLGRYLKEGDALVLNDTRVFPARLFAKRPSGGRMEILLVRPSETDPAVWLALVRGKQAGREGSRLILDDGSELVVKGYERPGRVWIAHSDGLPLDRVADRAGLLALPHYIKREVRAEDASEYQTVYARRQGAIAAPTAGLHFTSALLEALMEQGIRIAQLTLHIGPGTFVPVRAQEVEAHRMEAEWYTIPPAAHETIEQTRRTGGRVVCVGTSAVRALESWAVTGDSEGYTGLFIHCGFRFKIIDGLLTNFHMPRTTVLALAMAFAGPALLREAYRQALRRRYRFLSYGDAMLIL